MTVSTVTNQDINDFLYTEAKILDEWRLEEWVELFTDDGTYVIPPLGNPQADASKALFLAHDNRMRRGERAERLLKKEAHVEYPHSTTVHNYNNILVENLESDVIKVECNFTIHRTKREVMDTFIGKSEYELVHQDGKFSIKSKKVVLHMDSLRPHGKISLIL